MYIMYVDESGDPGMVNSPTSNFILSGVVVHELRWQSTLDAILTFRRTLRSKYQLKVRDEIHATDLIGAKGVLNGINKSYRLQILRDIADFQSTQSDLSIVNVAIEKSNKSPNFDVFDYAWRLLIQRFDNTIFFKNFPKSGNQLDAGIVVADKTDEPKLRTLLRKMRAYNPIPNTGNSGFRQMPLKVVIKDPIHRDSAHSYFVQLADVNAYLLRQKIHPSKYIKEKGARNYFDRLNPILCKVASKSDPFGVVRG